MAYSLTASSPLAAVLKSIAATSGLEIEFVQSADPKATPVLHTSHGKTQGEFHGSRAIVLHVCEMSTPSSNQAMKEATAVWVDIAERYTRLGSAWLAEAQPTKLKISDSTQRELSAQSLEVELKDLDKLLSSRPFVTGQEFTAADAVVVNSLQHLFAKVIGKAGQTKFAHVVKWLSKCMESPSLKDVKAGFSMCASADAWPANDVSAAGADKAEVDPEKAAKKLEKLKAKEEKKAKALAKAAAAEAAKSAPQKEKKEKAKKVKEVDQKEIKALEEANATKAGSKKTLSEMPNAYNPVYVEKVWYDWWDQQGFFSPTMGSKKPKFVMVIPPPNVTGSLHIGHALTNSIQDTITRWRRMGGYEALWLPGTDHAGIATQSVVEKKLAKEQGLTRHDLGREKFLEKTFEWKEQYGNKITTQLRRLGSSLDWPRESFTMDAKLTKAVQHAFLQLHDQGLVYRDNRLVNWSTKLKTAISDIEVDYIDVPAFTKLNVPGYDKQVEFGVLTSFAYKLEEGNGEVVVATTRIETMLGDTAVAVHPEDDRYKHLHGKFVVHPFNGRRIPIITDAILVDMAFGTGAVKITPAHDPNDFETGKRHGLKFISCFTEEGTINSEGGERFTGMPRFTARSKIIEALEEIDQYRGKAGNDMRLGLCSRSKDVVEPMLKPQWWVSCKSMAQGACDAARDGRLDIQPKAMEPTWFRWLENIRDWCVSRQLWWGHQIPAYYITIEGEGSTVPGTSNEKLDNWVVAADEADALAKAKARYPGKKVSVKRDEDVLDTWFSSGIFPFSVFGWPEQTADLAEFYPTSLLETGHDILFFWVARMVMMGMQLTGKVPFKQVYLHAMVRDAHGRKMSKSLGNVIDPTDVIDGISLEALQESLKSGNLDEKEIKKAMDGQKTDFPDGIPECGTDALRFALVSYTSQGRDINLDILRVNAYRQWCNKLWNAIRFAMTNLGENFSPTPKLDVYSLPLPARWILSRFSAASKAVNKSMTEFAFSTATTAVYAFWQYDLCDVFIEVIKPILQGTDAQAKCDVRDALYVALEGGLRLLHPFMPFVTEELWQRLPRSLVCKDVQSIMLAPFPEGNQEWDSKHLEGEMDMIMSVAKATRSIRAQYDLLPKNKTMLYVVSDSAATARVVAAGKSEICTLSNSSELEITSRDSVPPGCLVSVVDGQTTAHVLLKGVLDAKVEIEKLKKKQDGVRKSIAGLEKTMSAKTYAEKTPEKVRTANDEKMEKLKSELTSFCDAEKSLAALLE